MSQAVMNKDITGKRKNLRLVLQPAEGGGEDQPIIIALEVGALMFALVIGFDAESAA